MCEIVKTKHGKIKIINTINKRIGNRNKKYVQYLCLICGYKGEIRIDSLNSGSGCPVCCPTAQKVVKGINDIATTHPHLVKYFVNKEDTYKYNSGSHKKVEIKCPDCGYIKKKEIRDIVNKGYCCSKCSDGKSYPEKFVFNLLEQLNVDFETEYKPSWIDNKRYDFYIKDNDCIIETHGEQHYSNISNFKSLGGRNLEEEQINDKFKKETALKNGIKHYIELDCRESSLDWIKNSILNSELNELFDLSNIDWNKCGEFANKNIVKEVCDYWSNKKEDETTVDLAKKFNLDRHTILKYLKLGKEIGLCNYDSKEMDKIRCKKIGRSKSKGVLVYKNNVLIGEYKSLADLENRSMEIYKTILHHSAVSKCCNNIISQYKGYNFKFKGGEYVN